MQIEHRCGHIMKPRAEVQAIFPLLVDNRGVAPIRYCGDPLVVDWDSGQLRILTENGRSFIALTLLSLGLWGAFYLTASWLAAALLFSNRDLECYSLPLLRLR